MSIFNYFIKEEEEYRLDIISNESKLEKKELKESENYKEQDDLLRNINIINKEKYNRKWLVYNNFSCRYDCFFVIFSFIIKNKIDIFKEKVYGNYIELYNMISEEVLISDSDELDKDFGYYYTIYTKLSIFKK